MCDEKSDKFPLCMLCDELVNGYDDSDDPGVHCRDDGIFSFGNGDEDGLDDSESEGRRHICAAGACLR